MSQGNESSKISYFNTLIFTIISGVISLVLLMLLFFEFGKEWMYLIITVEVGIFSVIGICLYQIIKNELLINGLKKGLPQRISFSECPDYFLRGENNGVTVCNNNYPVVDNRGRKFTLRIYPLDTDLPTSLPIPLLDVNEQIKLYEIEQSNRVLKDAKEECAVVMNEPPVGNTDLRPFRGYSKLPWTHARSRCGPYVDV